MSDSVPSIDELSVSSSSTLSSMTLAATLDVEPHSSYKYCPNSRPVIVGHRGSIYDEPENTLSSFEHAANIGCDAVELDVFLLKCGTLVIFHGGGPENLGSLDDHCGVLGNILDLTYEQVQSLKMNPEFEEFVCPKEKVLNAKIPTLEEVLVLAKGRGLMLSIELKGPGTAEAVLEVVEEYDMVDQVIFSCFHMDRIKLIRDLRPDLEVSFNFDVNGSDKMQKQQQRFRYKTAALFEDVPPNLVDICIEAGVSEVHLRYDTCVKSRITELHARGMKTLAWMKSPPLIVSDCKERYLDVGHEDEKMFRTIMNSGVNSICTNRPGILKKCFS